MTVKIFNQSDMAKVFGKYGAPNEIENANGSYTPYGTETENELFDEAMDMLIGSTEGFVLLHYLNY